MGFAIVARFVDVSESASKLIPVGMVRFCYFGAHHRCSVILSSDRFGWPLGAGIDETGPSRPLGVGARFGNTDAVALNSGFGFVEPSATR